MTRDIETYIEETIFPLIADKHPDLAPEVSIQILGSYGLGIADEFSDLEVALWLQDPLWQARGGQLQLTLLHDAPRFADTPDHLELCVWPLSWLGPRKDFLETRAEPPWEQVSIEEFYELQEALVVRDPGGIFARLRSATAPQRLPDWLWKKLLITELARLVVEDLCEFRQAVKRHHTLEGHVLLGCVLQDLLRIGFILNKRYYPWRTYLRWAFEKLPLVAPAALAHLDTATSSPDWEDRLAAVDAVRDLYCEHIQRHDLLPGINMSTPRLIEELTWAQRLEAWSNPNWRERIGRYRARAIAAGREPGDFWVWSLWRCAAESDDNDRGELNDGDR
jgi:hypothetical protein